MNNDILLSKVKKKKYIFFDIFDTILHRKIEPEYIKKIWSTYISKIFLENINSYDIYKSRNELEEEICNQNYLKGYSKEFEYKEMIRGIYNKYKQCINVSFKDFFDTSQDIEFEIEKNALYVDQEMLENIKYLFQTKKDLYCISDIYLDENVVRKLFEYFKLNKYFKKIFLSSEYLRTKNDGSLYKLVLNELKINADDCIMIGDNFYSDIKMSNNNNIQSILIDSTNYKEQYGKFNEKFDIYNVTQDFENFSKKVQGNFINITYPLYLFTRNLYYSLIKDKAKCVFFFAREGQFLKKIFDEFQENIIGPKIKTEYLYVSRTSTFLASLNKIKEEKFETLLNQYPNISLKIFCKNLAYTSDDIKLLSNELNLDFNKIINKLKNSLEFKKLINNKIFIEKYNTYRKDSKKIFMKYLNHFNIDISKEMFVVDVGWKGTIQNNIQLILPKCNIKGYYLGLVHYDNIRDYHKKEAVLFENTLKNKSKNGYLYNSNRSLFEILLSANHGSTLKYELNGKMAEPILKNEKKEQELFENIIKDIQDNIFKHFQTINTILKFQFFDENKIEKTSNKKYFEMIFNPTKKEIKTFNKFYHFENFGIMNYSYFNKKSNISLFQKMKHYRHFRSFIQNDDSWQYLKLHNNNMILGKIILYNYKRYKFKKENLF